MRIFLPQWAILNEDFLNNLQAAYVVLSDSNIFVKCWTNFHIFRKFIKVFFSKSFWLCNSYTYETLFEYNIFGKLEHRRKVLGN